MRKQLFTFALVLIGISIYAQSFNQNPDPNGLPWISGDAHAEPTFIFDWNYINFIPDQASYNKVLPDAVQNDILPFFPYIKRQEGASCVQVSEIWYIYTYEINRKFDRIATHLWPNLENTFHNLYTYNYLSGGNFEASTGSLDGYALIYQNGCPPATTYWDPVLDANTNDKFLYWMTGYEKYKEGMGYGLTKNIFEFPFSLDTSFINRSRHWIADHGEGDITGGLLEIGIRTLPSSSFIYYHTLPAGSSHAGDYYISSLGTDPLSGHALTITGYDDNIKIDWGGGGTASNPQPDGQFRNDFDNNRDGNIDIRDWEIGAFKVANSWGTGWTYSNQGFTWLPYHFCYPGNPGLNMIDARCCDVSGSMPQSDINFKINMEHDKRAKLECSAGYTALANATNPIWKKSIVYDKAGGMNKMRGCYNGPIDLGLSYSRIYNPEDVGQVFFKVKEINSSGTDYHGKINSFSMIDDRWGESFELPYNQSNINIPYDGEVVIAINYHLLPHHDDHITSTYTLTDDRVSRFTTNVDDGGNLNIRYAVNIDMYNSIIHINDGGTLTLNGNNTITAKRGNCQIIVDGTIDTINGIRLEAEEGATLELIIRKGAVLSNDTLKAITLENAKIINYSDNIIITGFQAFNNSTIQSYGGNVTIMNGGCEESNIRLENFLSDQSAKATVKNVVFGGNNNNSIRALFVYNYGKYEISNNIIADYNMGIQLMLCGNGTSGNQIINNNQIYGHTLAGVLAYNTTGKFSGLNKIYDNGYGLQFFNKCLISIEGNSLATDISQTQQIYDNASYELYATQLGFPTYCRYNYISDSDNGGNPNDPIVYYDNDVHGSYQLIDVSRNCWGTGFNASQDLKINNGYIQFIPFWCPGGGGGNPTSNLAEQLYNTALAYADSGMCVIASSYYKEVIDQYPQSEYAMPAMKQLYHIEECAGGHYDSLSNYFLGNGSIINDSSLAFLGRYLSNECKIAQQDWPAAIAWYENQITHPYSPEDSLFALIDLEHLYIIMENSGLKQAVVGKIANLKPKSSEQFFQDADYYLSLLPFKKDDNKFQDLKLMDLCKLEQNTPNPFNSTTSIKYSLSQSAIVKIVITDITGRELYDKMEGNKDKGNYTVILNNLKLESGNYLYSIYLNDKLFDTKKMTIIK